MMSPESLIIARPHFRFIDDGVRFFLSSRVLKTLTSEERHIWDLIQVEPVAVSELADQKALESLVRSGFVEVIEPVFRPAPVKRILVIEPHSDDAALSIGGTLWKMREHAEFHILTMASRSNYTSAFHLHRDCFDRNEITEMRTREGQIFAEHLGGTYSVANMNEATLRYDDSDWNLNFYNAHEVSVAASNSRHASAAVLQEWVSWLISFLSKNTYDEIWIPFGIGNHADHDLTRNSALLALAKIQIPIVKFYYDVPYVSVHPEHRNVILSALTRCGFKLRSESVNITDVRDKKFALLSIFASQFKVKGIAAGVDRSTRSEDSGEYFERFEEVLNFPESLPISDMWIGRDNIRSIRHALTSWKGDSANLEKIALFSIGASGSWKTDLGTLTSAFPNAQFVVYAGPRVAAEYAAFPDGRVELRSVNSGTAAWVTAALREFSTWPPPFTR